MTENDEVTEVPIDFTNRKELKAKLEAQVTHPRFIMALLCQLQFGTVDRLRLVNTIMNFDSRAIMKALNALVEQGLR